MGTGRMPLRVESPPHLGAPRACPESAAARVLRAPAQGQREPLRLWYHRGAFLPAGVLVRASGLFRSPAMWDALSPDASGAGGLLARVVLIQTRFAGEVVCRKAHDPF